MKYRKKTTDEVAADQREWHRKWKSGEFMREANAAKARIEAVAAELLTACKALVAECKHLRDRHDEACDYIKEFHIDETRAEKQGKAVIAKAEGRQP